MVPFSGSKIVTCHRCAQAEEWKHKYEALKLEMVQKPDPLELQKQEEVCAARGGTSYLPTADGCNR